MVFSPGLNEGVQDTKEDIENERQGKEAEKGLIRDLREMVTNVLHRMTRYYCFFMIGVKPEEQEASIGSPERFRYNYSIL